MSDDERLNLRDLPPVDEPVEAPKRFSQTLLRHADGCMRSTYLYLRHNGGAPGVALDRGSAAHEFCERAMLLLIEQNEPHLEPDVAKVLVDELLDEHDEWSVPASEADDVRIMAYHWAQGMDVDPTSVVGVEQKFVLDIEGVTISGKIDLASLLPDGTLQIDDYKSSHAMPTQEEYDDSWQTRFYALLYLFGQPVEKVSDGAGGEVEERLPSMGDGLNWVQTREIYPRLKLREDGTLAMRSRMLSRTDVEDFKHDVARTIRRVQRALTTGKWPAMPGSWCSTCPCQAECPLPAQLRRYAGTVNTLDQAVEAWAWALRTKAEVAATEKEVKAWSKHNGPFVVGDLIFEWDTQEKWDTRWDELEPAVERAANFGEPFSLSMYRKRGISNTLKKRRLSAEELQARESDRGGAS